MTRFFIFLVIAALAGCQDKDFNNLHIHFNKLSSTQTGISFSNDLIENDTMNYFKFPYLYMGGGVAAGDINNDGLVDLYFTGNLVKNRLYLNKGNNKFEDISAKSGTEGDNRWYTGVTMADVNADGWLDIYVSVGGKFGTTENQLFINNQDNTFSEKARSYGLHEPSISIQSTFFDYDNDGLLDVFVANYPLVPVSMGNKFYKMKMDDNQKSESGHLFRNNGNNTFTDVTATSGVQNFGLTLGVVASDLNHDGYTDLYLSNDFNVPDYLYLNQGDGTFKDMLQLSTRHTSMFGMGIDIADFNNDALQDIVQVDMTPADHFRSKTNMASMRPDAFYEGVDLGFHYQYMHNTLQMNNGLDQAGLPKFSNISRFAHIATTDWSWASIFADFNNDGHKDIFITNGMKRDVNNNDSNMKLDSESFFGKISNYDPEIFPSVPISNYLYENAGNLDFHDITEQSGLGDKGFSNGTAYADLDNDGALDLIVNNIDESAFIYINEGSGSNFLKVSFEGPNNNPFGLNTKVSIFTNGTQQYQELTLTRGFQSSVAPELFFGVGKSKTIDSLMITWPDGNTQSLGSIQTNQSIKLNYVDSKSGKSLHYQQGKSYQNTSIPGLQFAHIEDEFNDYQREPLLPHKNSQIGPDIAVGDMNDNGLDDVFVTNAAGSPSRLFLQQEGGIFAEKTGPWIDEQDKEDTGVHLFDADGDDDLDIYLVRGGNDPSKPTEFYQDALYVNTTKGFVKQTNSLPPMPTSGEVVISADYDRDGDLDLFVGGRIVPGKYPLPANSHLLRNDTQSDDNPVFTDVSESVAKNLQNLGLVTSALWDDYDGDGALDLVVVGEWMEISFFRQENGAFTLSNEKLGTQKSNGWWNAITKIDVDQDGDMDYLCGNLGLNYKYKASIEKPFEVYSNDFDENNSLDIVLSYQKEGKKLPLRGRECSTQQIPSLKNRFETYEKFASASLDEIYGSSMLENSLNYQAFEFSHIWLENNGNGNFVSHTLPLSSQLSSINDFIELEDGKILAVGNLYVSEVETPRNDAGYGVVLEFDQTSNSMKTIPASSSGILLDGMIRSGVSLRTPTGTLYLMGVNDAPLQVWKKNESKSSDLLLTGRL